MYYIGFDLGTSALKMLLVDENGKIFKEVTREYPLIFPQPLWSEQDPGQWWNAVCTGLPELLDGIDRSQVKAIGSGGQMHGLVVLDEAGQVIRPTILWNDGRTGEETDYLNQVIGEEKMAEYTANIAFAGFTAPKLLWMKKHEPENFAKIAHIMLPKDYINYLLTGVYATDYSDASGLLMLDVEHKCWSKDMLRICGVTEAQMPQLFESSEAIGTLKPEVAAQLGLPENVLVCAGAGDNAGAAIGTGTVNDGDCNISLGTSGTIFISMDHFQPTPNHTLHNFAHASGAWHLMGVVLCAASCNKWFCEQILGTSDFAGEQTAISEENLGRNSVYFLPYLMGERTPHNDIYARGGFIGMGMDSNRADMLQAVFEGVAFGIRDSFEIAKSIGVNIKRSKICGGGAKSPLWCKIMANVLGIPLDLPTTEQGPGYGGAILAMVASGAYESIPAACDKLVSVRKTVEPDPELIERYNERYAHYKAMYPALKAIYPEL